MPKVTVDDGVEIAYWLDDFTDPWEEERGVILMHHGSGEHSKFYNRMVPALARRYRVLRFDARGRGESTAPPEGSTLSGEPDDVSRLGPRFVKDALSLIDHLGIPKVHFFGISSGGIVGVLFAASHPDRVESLILCTAPYKLPDDLVSTLCVGEKDIATAIAKLGFIEWMNQSTLLNLNVDPMKVEPGLADWEVAERRKISTHVMVGFFKWLQKVDLSDELPRIKAPTLILSGGGKGPAAYTIEQEHFMQQKIPTAKLVVFDDAVGHSIHMLAADRCTGAVLDYLQTIV